MKQILFVTWDGPQTSYMEGLFMPIFNEIQKQNEYKFHVVQFTWGTSERLAITKSKAVELGVNYTIAPIFRKPNVTIGSVISIFNGIQFLKKYIQKHNIDIVMPRSTIPSIMVNRLKKRNFSLVFDADGLAIEERVDFSNLSRNSKMYRFFKSEEKKMLNSADVVITRSNKAIAIHKETIHNKHREKFSVVFNGRNINIFNPNLALRQKIRSELNISNEAKVFVYCGSLGPQYGWDIMSSIFDQYQKQYLDSKFLIMTGNPEYAQQRLPKHLENSVLIKKVPFEEVPNFLNVADIAFAIREPKHSMKGVAPIKLGEYLLMGIPTIASAGIGDTEMLLKEIPNCFLYNHDNSNSVQEAFEFILNLKDINHDIIRSFGVLYFSIEKSAESYIQSLHKLSNICNK